MGKATNTKDYTKLYGQDINNLVKNPNNEDTIKTFIKEDNSFRGKGHDGVEFPFAPAQERVSYGKLQLAQDHVTPTSQTSFLHINGRRASHLVNTVTRQIMPPYENCYREITRHEPGQNKVFSNLRFSNVAEMYQFVSDNAGSVSGGIYQYGFSAECYDKIDNTIPSIAKIHGQNMFYSMLKGRKKYKLTMSILDDNVERGDYNQWIQDIIRTVTPYTTYTRVGGDGGNKMIRVPGNHRKMYGLLRGDALVDNFNSNRDTTNGVSIVPHASGPVGGYSVDHINSYYCGINMSGDSYDIYKKNEIVKYFDNIDSQSTVICYRLESAGSYAVFIKPVGIDMLTIPYFDTSKYDLYCYMHGRNRFNQLKKIDTSLIIQSGTYQDSFRIPKNLRHPLRHRTQSIRGYWETMSMRLVLRDKTTGKISPLSKPRIIWRSGRDKPLVADIRY